MEEVQILQEDISRKNFTEAFCQQCFAMGFNRIEEIIREDPGQLLARPGFTYEWLAELSTYLSKNKLLYKLQPIPGSNGG